MLINRSNLWSSGNDAAHLHEDLGFMGSCSTLVRSSPLDQIETRSSSLSTRTRPFVKMYMEVSWKKSKRATTLLLRFCWWILLLICCLPRTACPMSSGPQTQKCSILMTPIAIHHHHHHHSKFVFGPLLRVWRWSPSSRTRTSEGIHPIPSPLLVGTVRQMWETSSTLQEQRITTITIQSESNPSIYIWSLLVISIHHVGLPNHTQETQTFGITWKSWNQLKSPIGILYLVDLTFFPPSWTLIFWHKRSWSCQNSRSCHQVPLLKDDVIFKESAKYFLAIPFIGSNVC